MLFLIPALAFLLLTGLLLGPRILAGALNPILRDGRVPVTDEARRLHSTLMVADLHCDALLWNRDLNHRAGHGHVDVPRLLDGRVGLQVFAVVTKTPRRMNIEANTGDTDSITLLALLQRWPARTWASLPARALHQAAKLRRAAEGSHGALTLVTDRAKLEAHLVERANGSTVTAGLLGLEGLHALEGDLGNVDRLYQAGFRLFGLTHFFDNEVGGSAHGIAKSGLTKLGAAVVSRMGELGILVDLAHASPALMDDVFAITRGPVVISHGGVRGTCDNLRNVEDRHLKALAATGGVMGIGLWPTAVCGETPGDWARAVRYTADLIGTDHVALGSDWDGAVPAILDASDAIHLTQALLDQGFTREDVRRIMGDNVIRVLREALPA